MPSMNCLEGGVVDTFFRFQMAWPASASPGLSPTRGSGLGGVVDMLAAGAGAPPASLEPEWVHAAVKTSVAAERRLSLRCTMPDTSRGERIGNGAVQKPEPQRAQGSLQPSHHKTACNP